MADEPQQDGSLTPEERSELENLRAEKAAREQQAADAAARAELEHLRAEKARTAEQAARDERSVERQQKAARAMEPDDDLRMPLAQKVVLAVALVILAAGIYCIITK